MRLPRDLSGEALCRALARLGYAETRTTGSHRRLTATEHGEHHITVPLHRALRVGTLRGILTDVARHRQLSVDEVATRLFEP
jgi:predicted RNA binding protein YcfA (HicA-like mRNA interferase family)